MMKKENLTIEQTVALYKINKAAKRIRDVRYELRQKVWKLLNESLEMTFTKEEEDILAEYDIKIVLPEVSYSNGIKAYLIDEEALSIDPDKYFRDTCFDGFSMDSDSIIFEENDWINLDTSRESLNNLGFSEAGLEDIIDWQTTVNKYVREYETIRENFKKLKDALRDLKDYGVDRQKKLYLLKDCVIRSTELKPVKYQDFENCETKAGLYEINGYKFHMFLDDEEFEDTIPYGSNELERIDSDDKSSSQMSTDEAVSILLEYLGYPANSANDYLNGKLGDIASELGIKCVFPEYESNRYNRRYKHSRRDEWEDNDDDARDDGGWE